MRGIENTSEEFRASVKAMAGRLGVSALSLFLIMAFETGRTFSPSKRNKRSKAVGLIQFLPSTAKRMGTTAEALSRMTAVEQLEWVERFFTPYANRLRSLEDAYMAVLWPLAVGKPRDYVLWSEGAREYLDNKGLDVNHDGSVTVGEASDQVRAMMRPESVSTPLPAEILLIGDSLARGLGPAMAPEMAKRGATLTHRGEDGSSVAHWLAGSRTARAMTDSAPSLTLVSLGTNDAKGSDTEEAGKAAGELAREILRNGSAVAWIAPPSLPFPSASFRKGMAEALGGAGVRAFDSASLDIPRQPDRIHPTGEGYRVWGDAVIAWLTGDGTLSLSVPPTPSRIAETPRGSSSQHGIASAAILFMLPSVYLFRRR